MMVMMIIIINGSFADVF